MLLREYLDTIGQQYDRHAGFSTVPQALLHDAATELAGYGPGDFVVRASGGQNPIGATTTPWVGFFDPDESVSPMEGLYVVWLLRADLSAWTVSVNMGTERLYKRLKAQDEAVAKPSPREPRVLSLLRAESAAIRQGMDASLTQAWDATISLAGGGIRQRRYEAATVLGRTYKLPGLPSESELRHDLDQICVALQAAVQTKRQIAVLEPGFISTASAPAGLVNEKDAREFLFDPGVDKEGSVKAPRKSIKRTPRHEGGLRRYGEWLQGQGFQPATNVHPRDFIVQGSPEWIGEYKVVYGTDVARATREAHSQLKEYRHFIYPGQRVPLLAVFSAPVTDRRVSWLNAEGIAVVWFEDGIWRGCPIAVVSGLGLP